MKTFEMSGILEASRSCAGLLMQPPSLRPSHLHLITTHDLENLRVELSRGNVPSDLEAKLNRLAMGDLSHRFGCRTRCEDVTPLQ